MTQDNQLRSIREKSIRSTANEFQGDEILILELKNPIDFTLRYYRPMGQDGEELVHIKGIDCNSGELYCTDEDENEIEVFYSDLSEETITQLYDLINYRHYHITQLIF